MGHILNSFNEFKNLDILNTPYRLILKGYYDAGYKSGFIVETHEQKFLIESFVGHGFSCNPATLEDIIIELEEQINVFYINEEITLNDILNGNGMLLISSKGIEFNISYKNKLKFCTNEELIKKVFNVEHFYEKSYEKYMGCGKTRAFIKPIILDMGHHSCKK